jgi:transcription elongation GreA/GreB family factor
MEEDLQNVKIIDPETLQEGLAGIGSRVAVEEEGGEERAYSILGPWDVDLTLGRISYLSPIGSALIGRKTGESVQVRLPDGEITLRLKSVIPAPEAMPDNPEGE